MNKRSQLLILFLVIASTFMSCKKTSEIVVTNAVYKGEKDMAWAVAHYVEYPVEEMQFNRAGIVKVSFEVDAEGNVHSVKADTDSDITQAEVAIGRKKLEDKKILPINSPVLQSLIKSIERLNFEPAKKNGKPINSTITTSVEFLLI